MPSVDLDDTGLDRQLEKLDSRNLKASLQLDFARLQYYQLKLDSAQPAQIASAQERLIQLIQQRDALRAELDRLEGLN